MIFRICGSNIRVYIINFMLFIPHWNIKQIFNQITIINYYNDLGMYIYNIILRG